MIQKTLVLKNRLGLHARAAAKVVHAASPFRSTVTLLKDGMEVDAKSILGILLLAAGKGAEIEVKADGDDEAAAVRALAELVDRRFDEES